MVFLSSTRLGQGKENVKAYLKEHADTALEIENKIREKIICSRRTN